MKEQPKPYDVSYRQRGRIFWQTVKNVTGDFVFWEKTLNDMGKPLPFPTPTRVFDTDNGSRVDVPIEGTEFRYPPQRYRNIELLKNDEAKTKIF